MTASWDRVLEGSGSSAHFLEFARAGERRGGQGAGRFLAGALKRRGIAVAVATPENASAILGQLARMGVDPVDALQNKRLLLLESNEMLARFEHDGVIDADEFDATVGATMRDVRNRAGEAPVRAFGDMVGLLWERGFPDRAVQLEDLWNALQRRVDFGLFCGYPIDVFGCEFSPGALEGVLGTHTHLLPSGSSAELGRALDRAMDDVLGVDAQTVRSRIGSGARRDGPAMPKPEQIILWLRAHLPEFAQAILERARELYDAAAPRMYLRQEHSGA